MKISLVPGGLRIRRHFILFLHQKLSVFLPTPDNMDLAHSDLNVRKQAIDCYLRLLDLAAELDNRLSPTMAMSAGFVP